MMNSKQIPRNFLLALIFVIQFILACYSTPTDSTHIKNKLFTIVFYLIIIFQKIQRRYYDFPLMLSIPVEIGLIALFWITSNAFCFIFTVLMFIIYSLATYLLQSAQMPTPSGPYLVGYKSFKLEKSGIISVFYPTNQKGYDVPWLPDHEYIDILLDSAFHKNFPTILRLLFKYGVLFLEAIGLGVNKNASFLPNLTTFDILLFSPGLGGNRHAYSVFLKEMASQGYVVFSLDHIEKIIILPKHHWKDVSKFAPMIKEIRGEQLEIRHQAVIGLLDYVCDEKNLSNLFFGKENIINYGKIMLGGHSFGAVTAIYTALRDKRINGGIICLDPYVFPMKDEFLTKDLGLPLLVIHTESFDKSIRYAENMERVEKIIKNNGKKQQTLNVICKNTDHLHQCDFIFLFPVFMKTMGFINKKTDINVITEFNARMMHIFIKEVVLMGKNSDFLWQELKNYVYKGQSGEKIFEII